MFINIQNVTKSFKSIRAVDNVSLQIPKGQFLALLGPNGAGKTTLVEMLEGIQTPDAGNIEINGKSWHYHPWEIRHMMGICLQETQYQEKVTVSEMMQLFSDIYQASPDQVQTLYHEFGLDHIKKQYVVTLSGGQKQKLSLMIALINQPQILILDEPTTGLDPQFRHEIWRLLLEYKHKGLTLILTTHYMEEAELLCDRIVMMNKGRIIKDGPQKELLQTLDFKHQIILQVHQKNQTPNFDAKQITTDISWNAIAGHGIIHTDDPATMLPLILNQLKTQEFTIEHLEVKHNTLEDVFIHLAGETLNA